MTAVPSSRDARVAGALYAAFTVVGSVRVFYVPIVLFVPGNAAASAARILRHETTFRLAMLAEVAAGLLLLLVVLALWRLLAPVNRTRAVVMAAVGGLMVVPVVLVNGLNDFAALLLVRGGGALSAIAQGDREALAALFLRLHEHGIAIHGLFRGVWLLLFASLVFGSRILPRLHGVLLILAGAAWVVSSVCFFALPTAGAARVANAILPAHAGELVVMLWLMVGGVRQHGPPTKTAG